MLNYETLLSSYDDKLTLMQWLKKVEAALKDASAISFKVNKKGDATLTFSIVFEDGSEIESGEIVLQQGESVESAAIVNGHLILTLTNGDELDAGQLLNGDLNVSGNLTASGAVSGASASITGDVSVGGDLPVTGVIRNDGFISPLNEDERTDRDITLTFASGLDAYGELTQGYCHIRTSNGKMNIVLNFNFHCTADASNVSQYPINGSIIYFPASMSSKIAALPNRNSGSVGNGSSVAFGNTASGSDISKRVVVDWFILKPSPTANNIRVYARTNNATLTAGFDYSFRIELNYIL